MTGFDFEDPPEPPVTRTEIRRWIVTTIVLIASFLVVIFGMHQRGIPT